jgi:hypothetical protein
MHKKETDNLSKPADASSTTREHSPSAQTTFRRKSASRAKFALLKKLDTKSGGNRREGENVENKTK